MKVIDIMCDSARLLGLGNECDILCDQTKDETEKMEDQTIRHLFELAKLSIRELCTNYAPVLTTSDVDTTNKTYAINKLTNCIRVEGVTQNGNPVNYKIINRNINFEQDGKYTIEYSSYPSISNLDDDLVFLQEYGLDVAVFGLCAYYCLTKGLFEDFDKYYQTYQEKASALKDMKVFMMPQRRWQWKLKKELW